MSIFPQPFSPRPPNIGRPDSDHTKAKNNEPGVEKAVFPLLFRRKKPYLFNEFNTGRTCVFASLFTRTPMKKFLVYTVTLLLIGNVAAAQKKAAPKTEKEKISYCIGAVIAKNQLQEIDLNQTFLFQGIKDILNNATPVLTEKEMEEALAAFQEKMAKKMQLKADKNKKNGEAFLAQNKSKEGVITLADGLQYKIIKNGDGPKPTATQTVKVHYRGTFIDGTEFDNSYKRGEPIEFPLNGVIKGWTEALQLMPVGSTWQLFIPSDLAYGPEGRGASMPPNSVLIFEIELLSIK
jgi:FKBP-type peptidyl-prolyl cis-trans isomerase